MLISKACVLKLVHKSVRLRVHGVDDVQRRNEARRGAGIDSESNECDHIHDLKQFRQEGQLGARVRTLQGRIHLRYNGRSVINRNAKKDTVPGI